MKDKRKGGEKRKKAVEEKLIIHSAIRKY